MPLGSALAIEHLSLATAGLVGPSARHAPAAPVRCGTSAMRDLLDPANPDDFRAARGGHYLQHNGLVTKLTPSGPAKNARGPFVHRRAVLDLLNGDRRSGVVVTGDVPGDGLTPNNVNLPDAGETASIDPSVSGIAGAMSFSWTPVPAPVTLGDRSFVGPPKRRHRRACPASARRHERGRKPVGRVTCAERQTRPDR